MQTHPVAVQIGDMGKKALARWQRLAWQGNLPTGSQGTRQRDVQAGRRIPVDRTFRSESFPIRVTGRR